MSMNIADVEQALLALDQRERAAVIQRGIRSLDAGDANVSPHEIGEAWRSELGRRIDEVESGTVEALAAEDSHARIRSELADRRK